jgi:hypothetical protein
MGSQGETGPTGRAAALGFDSGTIAFTSLSSGTVSTNTLTSSVVNANALVIQGLSNDTPASVGGIVSLYITPGGTYNVINLSVIGSSGGGDTTYTVYYYGIE